MTTTIDTLVEALTIAVIQNNSDMVMTGEELRSCEAALALARAEQAEPVATLFGSLPVFDTPAAPVAKPSRFGSPELQTMILANLSTPTSSEAGAADTTVANFPLFLRNEYVQAWLARG